MSSRVLVTGGAGFIGCHVARALLQRGYKVRVLDSLIDQVHTRGAVRDGVLNHVELIRADVRDLDRVSAALEGVDNVIHLAAEVGVGQSMYAIDRYVSVNDHGTAVLFQALIDRPVGRASLSRVLDVACMARACIATSTGAHVGRGCGAAPRIAWRSGFDPVGPEGGPLTPVADARDQTSAQPRIRIRADEIRPGAPYPHSSQRPTEWRAWRYGSSTSTDPARP